MRYLWLTLAFLAGVVGVLGGRFLGLSSDVTATIAAGIMFLAMFPFMKQYAPKLRFSVWVLATMISAAVTGVLFYVFR